MPTKVENHNYQFANLVGNALALSVGLLPANNHNEIFENIRGCVILKVSSLASNHGHILALLPLHVSADRTWDLLADRVSHLNDPEGENQALLILHNMHNRVNQTYYRADFVGQGNALSIRFLSA